MSSESNQIADLVKRKYQHGFVTDIEQDTVPPGLDEGVIRLISAKKGEPAFLTQWRLKAFEHWQTMDEPTWAHVRYTPIDYQSISYYSAPKTNANAPKSLDEVDPKLLETYDKLGIPLHERARLAGVAVDAVFDSVSVATTFREKLAEAGVIFCSFSDAVRSHPGLVEQYLGRDLHLLPAPDVVEVHREVAHAPTRLGPADLHAPSVAHERFHHVAGEREGGVAPQVFLVVGARDVLGVVEALHRDRLAAIRQSQQHAREHEADVA